jgi:predicted RNase H-like HicB family nuclease
VVLEQENDGGFVANVAELPGCVSQGDTREAALENIKEAIELYLEHARQRGKILPRVTIESVEISDRKFGT